MALTSLIWGRGDFKMEFTAVFNKALKHKARVENTQKDFDDNIVRMGGYKSELNLLNGLYKNTSLAHDYLEALIKEESTKFIKRLRDVLDYGVKTIFYDEEYSIDIRTENDNTSIHLITKDVDGNQISPDIKVCGGGIRCCVGVLCQLFVLFHYRSAPILFVDEGFTQLSSQYIPYLMGLLQELSEKNGLKILLISHDPRLISHADKVYSIEDGKAVLKKSGGSNLRVGDSVE